MAESSENESDYAYGDLKLAIRYQAPKNGKTNAGTVHVDVISARNLHTTSNYVKFYINKLGEPIDDAKQKTALVKDTANPEFKETIKYKLLFPLSEMNQHQLAVSVWSTSKLQSKNVGGFTIPMREIARLEAEFKSWFALLGEPESFTQFAIVADTEDLMVADMATEDGPSSTVDGAANVNVNNETTATLPTEAEAEAETETPDTVTPVTDTLDTTTVSEPIATTVSEPTKATTTTVSESTTTTTTTAPPPTTTNDAPIANTEPTSAATTAPAPAPTPAVVSVTTPIASAQQKFTINSATTKISEV